MAPPTSSTKATSSPKEPLPMDMMDMDTYVEVKGKVAEARLLKLRRLLILVAKKTLIFILAFASAHICCKSCTPTQHTTSSRPNPMSHPYSCLFGDAFARPKIYILGHSTAGCGSCHLSSSTENGRASGRQFTQVPKAVITYNHG